jgi:hypothetical protein
LKKISFRIQLHRSIEIWIAADPRKSSISCDRVRFNCVVDAASLKLEIDPLVQAVTWGKIETEAWVETDRLITDCSIERNRCGEKGIDIRLRIISIVPLGDRHIGVDRPTECNPQSWPWTRHWLRLHVGQGQSLSKQIRSTKKHHDQ